METVTKCPTCGATCVVGGVVTHYYVPQSDGIIKKPLTLNICKDCKYYSKLVDTVQSWGSCTWFDYHNIPSLPFWSKVTTKSGAIPPKVGMQCPVFSPNEE